MKTPKQPYSGFLFLTAGMFIKHNIEQDGFCSFHLTKIKSCQSQTGEQVEQVEDGGRLVEQEAPVHHCTGIACGTQNQLF